MVEVKKEKNYVNFDAIKIVTEEGQFEISYEANYNLYIGFCVKDEAKLQDSVTFTITNEDEYLFNIINKLYKALKNNNPDSDIIPESVTDEIINKSLEMKNPYHNNRIEVYSDDFDIEDASVMNIEYLPKEDEYKFTFKRSKSNTKTNTYFVCISNFDSKYKPFNKSFMNLYFDLITYSQNKQMVRTR
ncbi:MAG: hypothetical protein J5634_00250 [Bacilli bacterium]|nr:hypothetical protein [Bacilli bacterium]